VALHWDDPERPRFEGPARVGARFVAATVDLGLRFVSGEPSFHDVPGAAPPLERRLVEANLVDVVATDDASGERGVFEVLSIFGVDEIGTRLVARSERGVREPLGAIVPASRWPGIRGGISHAGPLSVLHLHGQEYEELVVVAHGPGPTRRLLAHRLYVGGGEHWMALGCRVLEDDELVDLRRA
jgi:hypothetical protein